MTAKEEKTTVAKIKEILVNQIGDTGDLNEMNNNEEIKMEGITQRSEKIQNAVEKFSCTAKEWKGNILILDKKGNEIGHVKTEGTIVRKMSGRKQLMGALIRDAIKEVI